MLSLPIPFSEGPCQPSSDPICTEQRLQEMSLSPRETLSKACPRDNSVTKPPVQSNSSQDQILPSSVSMNQKLYFSPWLFRFFLFSLLQCLFQNCTSTTEAKARNLQLWNTCFSPHMLKALWQGLLMLLLTDAHLSTTPNDKYKALKPLSFLKNQSYIRA